MAQVNQDNAPLLDKDAEKMVGGPSAVEITDKPIASRIKSVLQWNQTKGVFEITTFEENKIRTHLNENQYHKFLETLHDLKRQNHPENRRVNCFVYLIYWFMAFIFLVALFYMFLIILQLALFNLIMLVVMIVWWIRMFKVCRAIIKRCIDSSRTKHYRSFIKALKGLDCVKQQSIEIQEHDEGQWIAVHLPDTAEDDSEEEELDDFGMDQEEDEDQTDLGESQLL